MQTTMGIIRAGVDAVLDKYFTDELKRQISNELVGVIRADLDQYEPDRMESERNFHDCVNELCLKCGRYNREHDGACDGCRWLKPRRGW